MIKVEMEMRRWGNPPPAFPPELNVLERSPFSRQTPEVSRTNSEGRTTVQITPKAVIEETPTVFDSQGTGAFTLNGNLRHTPTASSFQADQTPRALSPEVGTNKLAWMIKAHRTKIISPNQLRFPLQVK